MTTYSHKKIPNLWYGPPDQQPLEEVIKDMSLKEVKFFASDLFVPIYEDLDILDDSVKVEKGDFVQSGQIIALSGNTGELITGPHLHLEIWDSQGPLNPENLIKF